MKLRLDWDKKMYGCFFFLLNGGFGGSLVFILPLKTIKILEYSVSPVCDASRACEFILIDKQTTTCSIHLIVIYSYVKWQV